ncbi:MAG: ChrR family anti-sigma-E factor [Rhodospirillales bacterium]|nr:ChrR family anti-sigma-E factor [Rhodospirillales bacterium]MDE2458342.1 ChrR family anti-sigma-E factor [Rhodospirillales bacterium]
MIRHHPAPETLLAHVAGTLAPGQALTAAVHVQGCAHCQAQTRRLEAAGGALLEDVVPEPLAADAFAAVMARLDEPAPPPPPKPRQADLRLPPGLVLPAALRGAAIGRWLWMGLGLRYSRVTLPWAPKENVMLLRVEGGRRVLRHSHGGAELTQVLWGGFHDITGAYGPGDLQEADETIEHQPLADPEGCLCLAALEGGLRLPWISRLMGK